MPLIIDLGRTCGPSSRAPRMIARGTTLFLQCFLQQLRNNFVDAGFAFGGQRADLSDQLTVELDGKGHQARGLIKATLLAPVNRPGIAAGKATGAGIISHPVHQLHRIELLQFRGLHRHGECQQYRLSESNGKIGERQARRAAGLLRSATTAIAAVPGVPSTAATTLAGPLVEFFATARFVLSLGTVVVAGLLHASGAAAVLALMDGAGLRIRCAGAITRSKGNFELIELVPLLVGAVAVGDRQQFLHARPR